MQTIYFLISRSIQSRANPPFDTGFGQQRHEFGAIPLYRRQSNGEHPRFVEVDPVVV